MGPRLGARRRRGRRGWRWYSWLCGRSCRRRHRRRPRPFGRRGGHQIGASSWRNSQQGGHGRRHLSAAILLATVFLLATVLLLTAVLVAAELVAAQRKLRIIATAPARELSADLVARCTFARHALAVVAGNACVPQLTFATNSELKSPHFGQDPSTLV